MNLSRVFYVYICESTFRKLKGGVTDTRPFEELLKPCRSAIERYCKFKLPTVTDAEDILSEVYLTAYRRFSQLKSEDSFKPWILGIARRKCADFYRMRAMRAEIPIEDVSEDVLTVGNAGTIVADVVRATLDRLPPTDSEILELFYFDELPQAEISRRLGIPLGTVKSRLHTAKEHFRVNYPYRHTKAKGESVMTKLPKILPNYTIKKSDNPPFEVRHEELPGMLIIPRAGEKLAFGMYDFPERTLSGMYRLEVTGEVVIHGIKGTEISSNYSGTDGEKENNIIFAQLTDSYCRYLGGMSAGDDGVRRITTFLDGDAFTDSYAIGENNCGFEVNRSQKEIITAHGDGLITNITDDVSDIIARYDVTIDGKRYDTVRLVDMQSSNDSYMLCEYYLDKNGRTVLWRRFNRDDWAYHRYGKKWTEMLPDNERISVNGETYVHWYDCVSDYIF